MERWSKVINFEDIGKHYGSPLYIFSPQQLKENFDSYLNFTCLPEYIKYPVKTNPSLDVLRYIAKFGGGADCAHNSEVQLALAAGIPYERIIYNTPAPEKELTLKLLYAGADVVFDSLDFLDFIEKQADLPNVKGRIFARILPNIEIPYLDIKNELNKDNAHADRNSKFGIEPEELLHYCQRHTKMKLSGLHMHPGTRLDNLDAFIKTIQVMNKVAEELSNNTPHFITILDIGGGLGVLYKPDDIYPSIEKWTLTLIPLKKPNFQYYVEPGNSLVGNTMGLLSKIILIKKRSKKNFAVLDVGNDQLLYNRPLYILNVNHTPLPTEGEDSIVGPLCFAGDIILPKTNIGHFKIGDFLFIQHCGAYCYAKSSHFNGRQYGGMVRIDKENQVIQTNIPENMCLNSIYTTYQWPCTL